MSLRFHRIAPGHYARDVLVEIASNSFSEVRPVRVDIHKAEAPADHWYTIWRDQQDAITYLEGEDAHSTLRDAKRSVVAILKRGIIRDERFGYCVRATDL